MKLINLFFTAILFVSLSANAQITKGNWMVGGSASYSTSNTTNQQGDKLSSGIGLSINPNLGYFFIDQLAGGTQLNFNYGKPSGGYSNTSYSISPFLRYYFLKPDKIINIFTEISYGYGISKSQNDKSSFVRGYSLKAGPVIYVNSSVGLELTANYNSSYLEQTNNNYNHFTIGLGFQIHLEKDK